jgi:competence protein ComEC
VRGAATSEPGRDRRSSAPDLRLFGCAGAIWLTSLGALYVSAWYGLLVAVTAGALAAVLAYWARHSGRRWGWFVVGVLIGVLCGAAGTAARVAARDAEPLHDLVRHRAGVTVELTVTDDPRPVRGSGVGPREVAVPARLSRFETGGRAYRLDARLLVLAAEPGWQGLLPGTRVRAGGRLLPARGGDLRAAVLSATGPPSWTGTAPLAQRMAGALRTGLRQACSPLPAAPGGLLPGLVDGDTGRLDPAVAGDFRATGMTHLVAVSGANLAIVGGLVLGVARWCRAGPRTAAVLCALATVGFVILARPSPSVLRAAAMGALGVVALALGRPRAAVPALAAGTALLVLGDPELAADPGFALSVFATGGLLLLAPSLRDALRRRRVPAGLAEALAIPTAAQIACSPVIAGVSGTVSLVAIPANLVAEPAVAPATILGVLAAVLSVAWPAGAAFLCWLASWPARFLVAVARYGAGAPGAVLPWPAGVTGALLLAGALAVALRAGRRPALRVLAGVCATAAVLGAVPVAVLAPGWPPTGALIVACDVGQGDSVVLPFAPGQAVVVDTGPEPLAPDRCLRSLGVRDVALLVLTHFHEDHVGGIDGVYRGRRVREIVTSGYPEPAGGRDRVLAVANTHHTPVSAPVPGWLWQAGELRLTVLGPVRRLTGTDSDPNNNSLVIMAQHDGRRILLAGDAEVEEQTELAGTIGPGLRADVLKFAHHGSAKQDPAFLAAVAPAVALVSVGAGNVYGLPNVATLAQVRATGTTVLRTDQDGDIAAVVRGGVLGVVRHGLPPGRHPP